MVWISHFAVRDISNGERIFPLPYPRWVGVDSDGILLHSDSDSTAAKNKIHPSPKLPNHVLTTFEARIIIAEELTKQAAAAKNGGILQRGEYSRYNKMAHLLNYSYFE